jgi:hypothetical protein
MSVKIMSQVWDHAPFEGAALLLLLALADAANDDGWCWPSLETLQKKTRQPKRTVYAAIKTLLENGWLTKDKETQKGRVYFRVSFPASPESSATIAQPSATIAQPSATIAQISATIAKPPHPLIGRTVIEPSVNLVLTPAEPRMPGLSQLFLQDLNVYWKNFPGHESENLPMDDAAGRNLKAWFAAHPDMTREKWQKWLNNMAISKNVNSAWSVRNIISRIHEYADGPLDRFGKLQSASPESK